MLKQQQEHNGLWQQWQAAGNTSTLVAGSLAPQHLLAHELLFGARQCAVAIHTIQ